MGKQLGFFAGSLRSNIVIPITRKVNLINGLYAGTSFGDSIPVHYRFYMGGMGSSSLRGLFPFAGLDFMQETGQHILIERLDLQWELWNDNFLLIKGNVGKSTEYRKNLFSLDDLTVGYGVGFGYRSPIGPLEINLMTSNKNQKAIWFINIGYWF